MGIKLVFGEVRFSYANVWEPKQMEGSDRAQYSTSILIPKENTELVEKIKKAIKEATQEGISKFGGKIPNDLTLPLHDGDIERPEDENYAGHYYMNAKSNYAPGIIDKRKQEIIDKEEFYSGCYGYISVTFYAFNKNVNKGIACSLNNIMKTRDGEPLSGRNKAEDDFADITLDNETTDELDDLFS